MREPGGRQGFDLDDVSRIIRSLAMYSAQAAQEAQSEVNEEIDSMRMRLSSTLVSHIDAVMYDKDLNLEDEDSSIDVHMLRRLKQNAKELCP